MVAEGKYKTYSEVHDSNISWLREIPSHWDLKKFKNLFRIRKRIAGQLGFDVLSITQKGIKVKDIKSGDGQLSMDYSKYQVVNGGDFAMNHMDLLTGYVDVSKYVGVTSPDYRVFTLEDKNSNKRFYLYLLQLCYIAKIFFPLGQGAAHIGRWRLPTEAFNEFVAPSPTCEEQQQIANFLDHETAKIDTLIEKQQQLIKLLKEKRQAVISHAVTKGLNPNAPMKDSGIEWLGKIPAHWEVKKISHIALLQSGDAIVSEQIETVGDYPVFGGNGLRGYTNNYNHEGFYILIGRQGALCGNINYGEGKFWASEHAVVVHPMKSFNTIYFGETLRAMNLNQYNVSAAQPGLAVTNITCLRAPFPPIEEQKQIAEFVGSETAKIDKLVSKSKQAIELIQERRTALISAAVTGKIDVRHHGFQK